MGGIVYTPNYRKKPQEPDDPATNLEYVVSFEGED